MVSYTGEELNRFFNQVDLMRNFFPHNLSTVSPFAQAIGELWRYKPESEKVDACYKRIADCFIPQSTNPDFEEAQFKKAKSHFLDVVVKELESKASRSVYEKVGCIWRIFFESCALIDRAFPKTISPYLDGHLRHFIALTTNCVDMARDIESIKKQLQEKLTDPIFLSLQTRRSQTEARIGIFKVSFRV